MKEDEWFRRRLARDIRTGDTGAVISVSDHVMCVCVRSGFAAVAAAAASACRKDKLKNVKDER